ncbi:hypothetical protein VTO42DRAFT_112 [Malbranchea cinnamomea]
MDERGLPPWVSTVREPANVLANRDNSTTPHSPTVGECWVNRFLKRHPEIKPDFPDYMTMSEPISTGYTILLRPAFTWGYWEPRLLLAQSPRPKHVQPGNAEWSLC